MDKHSVIKEPDLDEIMEVDRKIKEDTIKKIENE